MKFKIKDPGSAITHFIGMLMAIFAAVPLLIKAAHEPGHLYLTAAKKLKVKPEECIAVEDSSYGIAAGNAAGMRVLAYADDRYGVDQSKAYARIHHMQEIKKYLND